MVFSFITFIIRFVTVAAVIAVVVGIFAITVRMILKSSVKREHEEPRIGRDRKELRALFDKQDIRDAVYREMSSRCGKKVTSLSYRAASNVLALSCVEKNGWRSEQEEYRIVCDSENPVPGSDIPSRIVLVPVGKDDREQSADNALSIDMYGYLVNKKKEEEKAEEERKVVIRSGHGERRYETVIDDDERNADPSVSHRMHREDNSKKDLPDSGSCGADIASELPSEEELVRTISELFRASKVDDPGGIRELRPLFGEKLDSSSHPVMDDLSRIDQSIANIAARSDGDEVIKGIVISWLDTASSAMQRYLSLSTYRRKSREQEKAMESIAASLREMADALDKILAETYEMECAKATIEASVLKDMVEAYGTAQMNVEV